MIYLIAHSESDSFIITKDRDLQTYYDNMCDVFSFDNLKELMEYKRMLEKNWKIKPDREKGETLCNGCGQIIKFIKLKSGKFNPVDIELYNIQDNLVEPNLIVVSKNGEVGQIRNLQEGYISHFSTCPKSNNFRKSRAS